jgi:hypothetical protein
MTALLAAFDFKNLADQSRHDYSHLWTTRRRKRCAPLWRSGIVVAEVRWAGRVSPGLQQLNVEVPSVAAVF